LASLSEHKNRFNNISAPSKANCIQILVIFLEPLGYLVKGVRLCGHETQYTKREIFTKFWCGILFWKSQDEIGV